MNVKNNQIKGNYVLYYEPNHLYMKFSLFAILLCCLLFTSQVSQAQQSFNVLFIGNSYTGVNNLPQLIHDVALSAGDTLVFDSNTPGGYRLVDHYGNVTTHNKLQSGNWDYVVLQGQSQEPIASRNDFVNGASALDYLIRQYQPCAATMFYMTWGRKNGDASLCPTFPVACTYEGMDSTLRNNYMSIAANLQSEVSPVSAVWNYIRQHHPSIELYQADESHPSTAGSYAAACSFYAAIFKKDPTLITYNFGLSATDAANIRNAAKIRVYNNLSTWDLKQPPLADFRYEIGTGVNEVRFYNKRNAETYFWDFGDGSTSTSPSPVHSYAANGTYHVVSITSNCDPQGLHTHTADTVIQFCNHTPTIYTSNPWLCNIDTLWTQPADSYQWILGDDLLPETGQSVADYAKYGNTYFTVLATTGGCSELSEPFKESVEWSGYFFDIFPGLDPCEGDTVPFAVLHTSGSLSGIEIIRWYVNGIYQPQYDNEDTLYITGQGTYECKVIDPASNCPLDTTWYEIEFDCETGMLDIPDEISLRIYPNPATDFLNIQLDGNFRNDRVQLYNATGKLISETAITSTIRLNILHLPAGLYFVRLKSNRHPSLKFIKY